MHPADTLPLLLVEDDPAIADTVVYAFAREGMSMTHCLLLQDARQQLAHARFAALILDIGLPDGSGLDFCRSLRQDAATATLPILLLSARSDELDRVLGLELGADDYLTKPFSPRELVARLRALLRRSAMPTSAPVATARLQHDAAGQRMLLQGSPLPLTRMEYGLLACLLEHQGRILARDYLLDRVWGLQADSADRTVDTHVKTLRAKLREADPAHDYIVTHRGMGYSLTLPATP
ncbi:two-component system response regulator CreB [Brachymonas chironomi]|uniref:two-component system response regulator CreB n=1 Tax=Brachymonas chironomi TaxID=491919 RepID=UPI00037D9B51|nr:two-component system response regulator CreB [Brachymonas chironomi]